jgi:hypothetical protein
LLGVVESHISAGKHGAGGFAEGGDGEADAERDREGKSGNDDTVYRLSYPIGDSQGILAGGLREDKEELVASVASEEVVGAKARGDDFNDLFEGGVACRVASGIVDFV